MILFPGFLLVFVRILMVAMTAPLLGSRTVPVYVRALLALMITLCISPTVLSATDQAGLNQDELVQAVFSEAISGSLIGVGILIVFSTAMMIGSAVGQMSGIQLDSLAPSNSEFGQQPTSMLIGIVATATFVLVGGPELIVTTVMDSFVALPVGQAVANENVLGLLTTLLQQSFELTIRAIAPAIATLLIATILVGFLSRTLPQLNLIQVGLSSNMAIMITAILLTLGGCVWLVVDDVERASQFIVESLPASQQVTNE